MKIGLIYGSDTGNTEYVAKILRDEIGGDIVDIQEVFQADLKTIFGQYDFFIIGIPTWYDGEMQSEWADKAEELAEMDLTGIKVAIYGLGDQLDWGEYFCNGMGELATKIRAAGATLIGSWPIQGYEFTRTTALNDDGNFVGLALDEDRQPDLTATRIKTWLNQLKNELGVSDWQMELPESAVELI